MAKTPPPASTTRYGKRKLSPAALEKQAKKKSMTKGSTTYGSRKAGGKKADRRINTSESPGGLPEGNEKAGDVRARDIDTAKGPRAGGEAREAGNEGPNPFADLSVAEVGALLDEKPSLLDRALEAESALASPRKGVIEILTRAEKARDGGPRGTVLEALKQLGSKD